MVIGCEDVCAVRRIDRDRADLLVAGAEITFVQVLLAYFQRLP